MRKTARILANDRIALEDLRKIVNDATEWKEISLALGYSGKGETIATIRKYLTERGVNYSLLDGQPPIMDKHQKGVVRDLAVVEEQCKEDAYIAKYGKCDDEDDDDSSSTDDDDDEFDFAPEEELDLVTADEEFLKKCDEKWKQVMENVDVVEQDNAVAGSAPQPPGGCFLYKLSSTTSRSGHLKTSFLGRKAQLHRLSWMFAKRIRKIPRNNAQGQCVLIRHMCGRAWCCNPLHLRSGTYKKNMDDERKMMKSRDGEANGRSVITDDTARIVRWSLYPTDHPEFLTQRQRVEKFKNMDVTHDVLARIDAGYTHLNVPYRDGTYPSREKAEKTLQDAMVRREYHKNRKWTSEDWMAAWRYLEKNSVDSLTEFGNERCRLWTGPADSHTGYGVACANGIRASATLLAMLCREEALPLPGQVVSHLCHNPLCIRHIIFESQQENMQRSVRDGRPFGTLNVNAILEIRLEYFSFKSSESALAIKFKVSQQQVSRIVLWKCWEMLTNDAIEKAYAHYLKKTGGQDSREEDRLARKTENDYVFHRVFGQGLVDEKDEVYKKKQVVDVWTTLDPKTLLDHVNKTERVGLALESIGMVNDRSVRKRFQRFLDDRKIDRTHWVGTGDAKNRKKAVRPPNYEYLYNGIDLDVLRFMVKYSMSAVDVFRDYGAKSMSKNNEDKFRLFLEENCIPVPLQWDPARKISEAARNRNKKQKQ